MKKVSLLIALMVMSLCYSQEKDVNNNRSTNSAQTSKLFGKNEFKINALYFVLGAAELQYERILNEESSIGVRTLFTLDDEPAFYRRPFNLDGFYRFYFGKKPAAGFFVEGLASYNSFRDENYSYNSSTGQSTSTYDRVNGFGLGLQVGGKWITRKGIIFEINGGVGRNIISSAEFPEDRIFGRFGISTGYRF